MNDLNLRDDETRQLITDLIVLSSIPNELISSISEELAGKKPFVSLQGRAAGDSQARGR